MKNILIVDDEEIILELISIYFRADDYNVFCAISAKEALNIFNKNPIDLIILDVMMPELSGFDLCKTIRQASDVPIIFLTALKEDYNFIKGFECGADDYITKITNPKIILAKVKKLLSRTENSNETLSFKGVTIDKSAYSVYIDNEPVKFTKKEYELLVLLIENKNKILTRDLIIKKIWGFEYIGETRVVDSHIKKIRKKLGVYSNYIVTIVSVGYKLEVSK